MAKYTVTRSCGHDEVVNLIGPGKNREWRLDNVESQRLCYDCYQIERARKIEEENVKSAELAKEWELPELQGTEKQIAWAGTIRVELLEAMEAAVPRMIKYYGSRGLPQDQYRGAMDAIMSIKSASWWIEHRFDKQDQDGMYRAIREQAKLLADAQTDAPDGQQVEALVEATVRPENPVTETVAEIRVIDSTLKITFPEKREDFWQIVKLKMEWKDAAWKRTLGYKAGAPADRAAEAGHRLLAAGFSIRIFDTEIREKAISGEYKPECTRWVSRLTGGAYAGRLGVSWGRDDGDFYTQAKRLHGSRWDRPYVVVPAENFEEVLDFAKVYGFEFSSGAQEIIEQARQVKENALTAKVLLKNEQKVMPNTTPLVLEVPENVEIADEFKD